MLKYSKIIENRLYFPIVYNKNSLYYNMKSGNRNETIFQVYLDQSIVS